MDHISHALRVFSGIEDAIGVVFSIILFIGLVTIIALTGPTITKLKSYGCERGLAGHLKLLINNSARLYEGICMGQVASAEQRVQILGEVFDNNGNIHMTKQNVKLEWLAKPVYVAVNTVIDSFSVLLIKCYILKAPADAKNNSLFHSFLDRLLSRPVRSLDEMPSLQSLSVEYATISDIQRRIAMQKSISSVLPAVGLFGTLMGMFSAFTGTNFNDPDMQNVMTGLMLDFGTALWTTILAVLIKIFADLWYNLSLQRRVSILMSELMELKYYIFDMIEQSSALCSDVVTSAEEDASYQPADKPETPLLGDE